MNESQPSPAKKPNIFVQVIQRPLRPLYLAVRNEIMARGGLQPRGAYWYSSHNHIFQDVTSHRITLPNIVGYYHHAMAQFINIHGLGKRCLLVSESTAVKEMMAKIYPDAAFISCDLFPELMNHPSDARGTDVIWDVCDEPPSELNAHFSSIICHALLEHVIDPTGALKNMLSLLVSRGKFYFMTHTPSFAKHQIPRDYVRFHHDYFLDLPRYFGKSDEITITLEELYSKEGVIVGVYSRS